MAIFLVEALHQDVFPQATERTAAIRSQGADVNDSSTHVIHDCAESRSHLGSEPAKDSPSCGAQVGELQSAYD